MYMSLLAFGIIAAAAGVAMIGFGIPINEFSLGNTLLVAGTMAVVGGLILIGLADAVRQLRRIAEALMARSAPRAARPLAPSDPLSPGSSRPGPGPGRIPFPPKPNFQGRPRGPAPLEPRLAAAPSIDASKDGAFDRPPSPFPLMPRAPEPQAGQERDENPLSPRAPRNQEPDSRIGLTELVNETTLMETTVESASSTVTEVLPISRLDLSLRSPPPSDSAGQSGLFDSLWPADSRSRKAPIPEVEPKTSEVTPVNKEERAEERKQDEAAADVVSILKSGVIDGMAYTLYSDGSIEAELPQGTVRFGSIAELRVYLEKSS